MYISMISQIIIPLGICWVIQTFWTLEPHHIWTAIVLGHLTRATLSVIVFRRGRWRDIRVDISSGEAEPA
jgi:Na+-driven multidrug efflux pump